MFDWLTPKTFSITVACMIVVAAVVIILGSSNLTEEDMCSGYKYSKMQDVPAYCLKYFQE